MTSKTMLVARSGIGEIEQDLSARLGRMIVDDAKKSLLHDKKVECMLYCIE